MAILKKKDLQGLFILLAVIYLFDAVATVFFATFGAIVFAIIAGLAFFSGMQEGAGLIGDQRDESISWIIRASIAVMLVGVLFLYLYLVAIGILIAEITLFLPNDGIEIDLWGVYVHAIPSSRKQSSRPKPAEQKDENAAVPKNQDE